MGVGQIGSNKVKEQGRDRRSRPKAQGREESTNNPLGTHATDGHVSLLLLLVLLLCHMDLIGQELASWDLQQSPVRDEGEEVGVQRGLLEPPPPSHGTPPSSIHTHTSLPSLQGKKEGGGREGEGGRHEAAECERVDLNAGKTKAAPGPRPSTHTTTIQRTSVPRSCSPS